MLDNIKSLLPETVSRFDNIRRHLDLEQYEEEILKLEQRTLEEGFYSDREGSEKVFREITKKKYWINGIKKAIELKEDIDAFFEMLQDEPEDSQKDIIIELNENFEAFLKLVDDMELKGMLSNPEDTKNIIFTIHSGSGGTEAQDWANMILRMYTRYFDNNGFKYSEIELLPGDKVGVKTVTLEVKGEYAYGFLKSEIGVHRLIRISPFDSAHKRHTSFASVYVMPEVDDIEVVIDPKDLRIDTYRASGAGGQHINKTDSAVRITHLPTGVVAQSQSQRSQIFNKEAAMKMLKARLYQQKIDEEKAKLAEIEGNKKEISWGSQIRTYTFHPYSLVKDHRTSVETGNTQAVMDGDIQKFIKSYLLKFGSFG
ncbi:MAG: peptide chain release factor 2 [Candidatus Delongbacteria bacterium]|nr:peptide chain release factor 2 [Candidatus Delongbacteria bacterium]